MSSIYFFFSNWKQNKAKSIAKLSKMPILLLCLLFLLLLHFFILFLCEMKRNESNVHIVQPLLRINIMLFYCFNHQRRIVDRSEERKKNNIVTSSSSTSYKILRIKLPTIHHTHGSHTTHYSTQQNSKRR